MRYPRSGVSMVARPTRRVEPVTVMAGVERTSSTAMITNRTTAAVSPAARLMGANTRMPAPDSPADTSQIQTFGQSFSL